MGCVLPSSSVSVRQPSTPSSNRIARIGLWSLTSLQQRLLKTGGRLKKHARCYWLLLAENHLTRRLFAGMLGKIAALPVPAR
jgi:hypothetical protein